MNRWTFLTTVPGLWLLCWPRKTRRMRTALRLVPRAGLTRSWPWAWPLSAVMALSRMTAFWLMPRGSAPWGWSRCLCSSLDWCRWPSGPLVPEEPLDLGGRATFDWTLLECPLVAELLLGWDFCGVDPSDFGIFAVGPHRLSSRAWSSTLSSIIDSCIFFTADATFLINFCFKAFSWAFQFSGIQAWQTWHGVFLVHSCNLSLKGHCWHFSWLSPRLRKWEHLRNFGGGSWDEVVTWFRHFDYRKTWLL